MAFSFKEETVSVGRYEVWVGSGTSLLLVRSSAEAHIVRAPTNRVR